MMTEIYLTINEIEGLKKILKIYGDRQIKVTPTSNGFNIRYTKKQFKIKLKKKEKSFYQICEEAGVDLTKCVKCGAKNYCHPHHIIPKSKNGKDIPENCLPLCFDCHTGNNGIHLGKWKIEDLIDDKYLNELKEKMKNG